jgi:hypothetical protein
MNDLSTKQIAVINSKDAMKIIADEAKKVVANKFNTTVQMVEIAYAAGNENVKSMLAKLISKGINEAASLV